MIYICIPAYNESTTAGLLLWRIRKVFQGFSREYEIIVYDDASTDSTRETLEPYREVAPLTVLGSGEHLGYAHAINALCREVSRRTRYPRRDAMLLMQADFTDRPELIPELLKRFEGGADIVATTPADSAAPAPVRRLRRIAGFVQKLTMPGKHSAEAFTTYRCYRISVLRELIKARGDLPLVTRDGWAANAELLLRATPFARKIETIAQEPEYTLRARGTRLRPLASALDIYRVGKRARELAAPGVSP